MKRRIDELLARLRGEPERAELHVEAGQLFQQEGRQAEAVRHYLAAARVLGSPGHPSADNQRAVALLRQVLELSPSHHDALQLLGSIYLEAGRADLAADTFLALGEACRAEGKLLMAVSVVEGVTALRPNDPALWSRFAALNEEARMDFHAASAHATAAGLLLEGGDAEGAFRSALAAFHLAPELPALPPLLARLFALPSPPDAGPLLEEADRQARGGKLDAALAILRALHGTPWEKEARSREEKTGAAGPDPLRGRKILLVEDEREILLLLAQLLSAEGGTVLTAKDGEEGLELWRKERPSLVVTDAMLPKMHGFELCRTIKDEGGDRVRVMILTAVYKKYKYKGKVERDFGVDEYLDKPFQLDELLEALRRMASSLPALEPGEDAPAPGAPPAAAPAEGSRLTLLLAGEPDRGAVAKVADFCRAHGIVLREAADARQLFEELLREAPDLILIGDRLAGVAPEMAAWEVRKVLRLPSPALVLLARDPKRLEGAASEFNDRLLSPPDREGLEVVLRRHLTAREKEGGRGGTRVAALRQEALLEAKLERILRSQGQVEEYYRDRIRLLEEELARLRQHKEGN